MRVVVVVAGDVIDEEVETAVMEMAEERPLLLLLQVM